MARCFASSAAQFEKFKAARPLSAPKRYDGAIFAVQEPLLLSEWQSKQEFTRISWTCGSAPRLSAGPDCSIAVELPPLEHPATARTTQRQAPIQTASRPRRKIPTVQEIGLCIVSFPLMRSVACTTTDAMLRSAFRHRTILTIQPLYHPDASPTKQQLVQLATRRIFNGQFFARSISRRRN